MRLGRWTVAVLTSIFAKGFSSDPSAPGDQMGLSLHVSQSHPRSASQLPPLAATSFWFASIVLMIDVR